MNTENDLEQSIINYYNVHKLEQLSLNQMLSQLNIPLKQGLSTYNRLTKQGQLITIDDDQGISHMIIGLNQPIDGLKQYLKQHRKQINDVAQKLKINVSEAITVYCHASGISDKEKCWEISDWFTNN